MHLHAEQPEKNAIQSCQNYEIYIDKTCYTQSVLVDKTDVFVLPELHSLAELNVSYLQQLKTKPEILIIGHDGSPSFLTQAQYAKFIQDKIGVECMKINSACRTFNVLLGEYRKVSLILVL